MARFRLFARASEPTPLPPLGAPPPGNAPAWLSAPPGPWPATSAARPAGGPPRSPTDDPPTDPIGFPPVPGPSGGTAAPWPDPAEAAALAGAFAVDYLSWDEDDPARRGRVLRDYLPDPGSDPARLGWSGRGRQRAEFALPGRLLPDGDGRVLVDVRVRVTPFRQVGERGPAHVATAEPEPDIAGVPAAAPAPTGRGWRGLASSWIRLSVPVVLDGGRLVVDAWEETLGAEPPPVAVGGRAPHEHVLADDDEPVPELDAPRLGDAW